MERRSETGQDRSPLIASSRKIMRSAALAGLLLLMSDGMARSQRMPKLEPIRGARVGNLAHQFTLEDMEGKTYNLNELIERERVVHVVFWATWCFPCIEEIPQLREAYDKYHDRGLEVLGIVVNINQTRDGVRSFVEDYKVNYTILWDDDRIMGRYGVSNIPRNFLIGKDGIIRHAGTALPDDYPAVLERLLADGGPPEESTSP